MKVTIDKTKCVACNACGYNSNDLISSKNGQPATLKKGVDLNDAKVQKKIREVAEICPAQAIIVEE